ncbi:MAG: DUF6364 family protein [Ginsengibacter sp.]
MNTKLTLTIEESVIERAKLFAKNTGKSLSEIIENYLVAITQEDITNNLSPKLKKIVGVVSLPEDLNEEDELRSALENKHFFRYKHNC